MRLRVAARQGKRARDEEQAASAGAASAGAAGAAPGSGPAAAPVTTTTTTSGGGGGGGGGAALDETEVEEIRGLPTDTALTRLCGHLGSVPKFSQVAALLEARLGSDLTPQTAAAYHEALR